MLPLSEDIKKLQDHLKCLEEDTKRALLEHPSQSSWSELSRVTLTQLILFNRCREGEVSGMEVKTYLQRNKQTMQDEILQRLSPFEKKLVRISSGWKYGGKGATKCQSCSRQMSKNLWIFSSKQGTRLGFPQVIHIFLPDLTLDHRKTSVDVTAAEGCGAKNPENITSTKLRKHVATVSQLLNLQNNELDQLASFMGHDIEVHREFYRLPEETLQMAKVSRILFALQGGMAKYKGMSLDDITPNINCKENILKFSVFCDLHCFFVFKGENTLFNITTFCCS